ncbi:MAG: type IX secretion system outer membrane channel protein PorV, partial [Candidatus Aquicultor sp.]
DNVSTVAATLRYFSLGEITFTNDVGDPLGTYKPNEFAVDAAYSRILTDKLSLAVAGRFIYSNLTQGQYVQGVETSAGTSVAADVSLYWEDEVNWFASTPASFAWGINISNIGNKISYSKTNIERDFIPTNFRIGPRLTLDLDDYNTISFQVDVNKLLVPTPPIYSDSLFNSDGSRLIEGGKDPDVSVVQGMMQSWYDAPGGFSEEMREFSFAVGTEYWYTDVLALRGGFYYEDLTKGNRKYATLGVGLRYNVFGLDFSYLIPVTSDQNPLQNTLRFSLIFNLDKVGKSNTPE